MATKGRPSRAECLQWLRLTGRSQSDCIDALYPGASDVERGKFAACLRQWVRAERVSGATDIAAGERGTTPAVAAPQPASRAAANRADPVDERGGSDHHAVDLERIPSLRRQLSQAEQVVDAIIRSEQWRIYPQVDKRRFDVAAELEREMERVRQVVSLDPLPGAIMEFLESHREMVVRGADLERRRRERAERAEEG